MILLRVEFAVVKRWADAALSEGVRIVDAPDTQWFVITDGPIPAGCIALTAHPSHLEVRAVYVVPPRRGRGLGTRATEEIIMRARGRGLPIEACALKPAWYHARGFRTVGHNHHGIAVVRLEALWAGSSPLV